jgi:hypothetical protein
MCDVPSIPVTNYYWYDHTLPVPETLHLQSTLLLSLKVPGKQTPSPPSKFPNRAPMERDACCRSLAGCAITWVKFADPWDEILITIFGLVLMTSLCVALDSTKQSCLHVHILACVCVYQFSVIWCLVLCTLNNANLHQLYCVSLSIHSSPKWGILRLGGNSSFMLFTQLAFTVNFFLQNLFLK